MFRGCDRLNDYGFKGYKSHFNKCDLRTLRPPVSRCLFILIGEIIMDKELSNADRLSKLDDQQFRVALGQSYENLVRLEHLGMAVSTLAKAKAKNDIRDVISEARRRFPNVHNEDGGMYFSGDNVALENQLFPLLKAASKGDSVMEGDISRYEVWRNGEPFRMNWGDKTLTEEPFYNEARYLSFGSKDTYDSGVVKNPIEVGERTMSQKAAIKRVAAANVR